MSVCGQADEESVSEEPGAAPPRDEYQPKNVSKVVRLMTVMAYLLSVSMAAILLSFYYVCVWKSPDPPRLNDTELDKLSAQRQQADPLRDGYQHSFHQVTPSGGSNTTMKESIEEPSLNSTNPYAASTVTAEPAAVAPRSDVDAPAASIDDHNHTTPLFNSNSSII